MPVFLLPPQLYWSCFLCLAHTSQVVCIAQSLISSPFFCEACSSHLTCNQVHHHQNYPFLFSDLFCPYCLSTCNIVYISLPQILYILSPSARMYAPREQRSQFLFSCFVHWYCTWFMWCWVFIKYLLNVNLVVIFCFPLFLSYPIHCSLCFQLVCKPYEKKIPHLGCLISPPCQAPYREFRQHKTFLD